jgi:hypothetical protein
MRAFKLMTAALVATALLALAPPHATAQDAMDSPNMVESGDYVVHFNALPTTQIPPEAAQAYRITRSPNRGLLNIAVQRKSTGTNQAVTAEVQASATNLTGQRRDLSVREVRDGGAIYYLAETGVSNRETLIFEVTVLPSGATQPITLRFQQQFFTESLPGQSGP